MVLHVSGSLAKALVMQAQCVFRSFEAVWARLRCRLGEPFRAEQKAQSKIDTMPHEERVTTQHSSQHWTEAHLSGQVAGSTNAAVEEADLSGLPAEEESAAAAPSFFVEEDTCAELEASAEIADFEEATFL
eukprot:tig00021137_g18988.t1